ncbi:unnamed protein product [Durusdinium trenchii]|uniref:Uncharacterized protein n=1 Tax=Durusdinium trenchii TaxID=1381693 RepID=A0ABP0Q8P6_9DINO
MEPLRADSAIEWTTTSLQEGHRQELLGTIVRVHRLGKGLSFVHLQGEDGTPPTIVTFEAAVYASTSDSAIPKLRCGQPLGVLVEMQWREHIQRWLKTVITAWVPENLPGQTVMPLSSPPNGQHGRRKGLAACAGWVRCPLCPSSGRCFNRGSGFKQHLASLHADEADRDFETWAAAVATLADSQGIFPTRGGGVRGPSGPTRETPGRAAGAKHHVLPTGLIAARDGDAAALEAQLLAGWHPFAVGQQDHNGSSALDWAAGGGHLDCVKLLLPLASNVQVCRRDGRSPLHWAARFGRLEMCRFLLEVGLGRVEDRSADGTSPMMLACFGGHIDVVELLVQSRADLFARNSFDCDAGHFAGLGGSIEACRWLSEHGMSLLRPQCSGHTVLHKAAERGHLPLASFLISSFGEEDLKALRSLCPLGSDMESLWHKAHLPSAIARKHGHSECARELEKLAF